MSIRWLKNVLVDGQKTTLEIQLGERFIGDKTYTRINKEVEKWFKNESDDRDAIIKQGLGLLKNQLAGKKVETPEQQPYGFQP